VTTAKIADANVTTAKIANGGVTQAKLASGVAGNGPAFRAFNNAAQSIPNGVATKVILGVEEFDTNNNFANSRFTPTVAGYYYITGSTWIPTGVNNLSYQAELYKNGAYRSGSVANNFVSQFSDLVYLNGTTDYVELFVAQFSGTARNIGVTGTATFFSGFLARSA
jgi:hypothetical protein